MNSPWHRIPAMLLTLAFAVLGASRVALAEGSVWEELKPLIYPDRQLADGHGLIQLQAPIRAEDQRHMMVSAQAAFRDGRRVKSLTFIIDENPAPVSARFRFGAEGREKVDIGVTLRLDGPSEMHVVAEASDGALYVVGQLIKASGAGVCAASPMGDQKEAQASLGAMTLTDITERNSSGAGNATQPRRRARLDIRHPSNSGLQMNQITLLRIPMRAVSAVEVVEGQEPLFQMEGSISLSEDPRVDFTYQLNGASHLKAHMEDTGGASFDKEFAIEPNS